MNPLVVFKAARDSAANRALTCLKYVGLAVGYGAGVVSKVVGEVRTGVAEGYANVHRASDTAKAVTTIVETPTDVIDKSPHD